MMDDQMPESKAAAVMLAEAEPIEDQWANALDCGALGPVREEPQLFYQAQ
jgi:hypothetical protein